MKLSVIVDNYTARKGFLKDWGFSCLLNDWLLFDTGWHSDILFHNLEIMNIDLNKVKHIVISHDHYDHTGGLSEILSLTNKPELYYCDHRGQDKLQDFRLIFEDKQHPVSQVWLTKQFIFKYNGVFMNEQALIIKNQNGFSLLCGCSHPGIVKITRAIYEYFDINELNLAAGGFHLKDHNDKEILSTVQQLKALKIKYVAPSHCTGKKSMDVFKNYWGKNCLILGAGRILEI